jgi:hypothetical protein
VTKKNKTNRVFTDIFGTKNMHNIMYISSTKKDLEIIIHMGRFNVTICIFTVSFLIEKSDSINFFLSKISRQSCFLLEHLFLNITEFKFLCKKYDLWYFLDQITHFFMTCFYIFNFQVCQFPFVDKFMDVPIYSMFG